MARVMVLALFMYATLYAGMAKSREECAAAADPTKCMAGSDGEVLLQSKLAIDQTDVEEDGLDDKDKAVAESDDDVEGLDERGFRSLLLAMPLVLGNISNYSSLLSTQTLDHLSVTHKFGEDKASDVKLLLKDVDGFMTLMQEEVLDKDDNACPRNSVAGIGGCISRAMCLMQYYVDGNKGAADKKEVQKYALIEELYTRFKDMTWPQTISLLGLAERYNPKTPVGYSAPHQHACDADSAWDKDDSGASLLETSSEMATAYSRSAALVSASKASHAIMDAHTQNSSVAATVAALHRAWKPACEQLSCDGTNYRDLWRASHAHSMNLIETGASARHMSVHIRTRQRLEHRMQQFLGEHGKALADKIHKDDATTWRSAPRQYFNQNRGAFLQSMMGIITDKNAPLSTRVYPLRLIDGHNLQQSLLEQGKTQTLQFLRSDAALMVAKHADNDDDLIEDEDQDLVQADVDTTGEDDKLRTAPGDADGVPAWSRVGKGFHKSTSAVANFNTDSWDQFAAGIPKSKEDIAALDDAPGGMNHAEGLNVIPGVDQLATYSAKLDWGKYIKTITETAEATNTKLAEGEITGFESLGNDIDAVTTKFAHVAATATQEASKFLLSLLACSGSFAEGFGHGFGFKFPSDNEQEMTGVWPFGVQFAFGLTSGDEAAEEGIEDLINGELLGVSLNAQAGIVFGAVPGTNEAGGIRVGLGVTAGFGCEAGDENPQGGPDCKVDLALGAVGSALIPSVGCLGGDTVKSGSKTVETHAIGSFKCYFSYAATVTIMCCEFYLISGQGNCR